MIDASWIKSAGTGLIRGTLFTLIGFLFWQAAQLMQCIAMAGTDAASAAAVIAGMEMLMILSSAFGGCAVMDLCRRYSNKNLQNSLSHFRMLSAYVTLGTGFAAAVLTILFSGSIASFLVLSSETEHTALLARTIVVIAPSWLLIPMLYHCRACNEGIGLHRINVLSQIIENGIRLVLSFFLLIAVHSGGDASRSLMMASAGSWISVLPSLILYAFFDYRSDEENAGKQKSPDRAESSRRIMQRWLMSAAESTACGTLLALPAVLSIPMILSVGSSASMTYDQAAEVMQIICFYGRVLAGIGIAVCAAAASKRLNTMKETKDPKQRNALSKKIERYFCTVLYTAIPCLLFGRWFASEACNLFQVSQGSISWFRFCTVQGLLDTIAAASVLLVFAVRKKKEAAGYLCIGIAARYISCFLLMKFKGFDAAMASGWLASAVTGYLCIVQVVSHYEVRLRSFLLKSVFIIYAALCMNGVLVLFRIGKGTVLPDHVPGWLNLIAAVSAVIVYLLVTWLLKITEAVFGRK